MLLMMMMMMMMHLPEAIHKELLSYVVLTVGVLKGKIELELIWYNVNKNLKGWIWIMAQVCVGGKYLVVSVQH